MIKRFIIYLVIIILCSALLLTCSGCMSEGRDSGSGIWGRLRSIGNELPVGGLKLSLDNTNIIGVTDSTGLFRLDGIPAGSYTVRFVRYDALITQIDFSVTEEQSVNGDVIQLIWPAPALGSGFLSGVVLDEEDKPIMGAKVLLGMPDMNIQLTTTNEFGAYAFANLEVNGGYSLVVSIEDYEPASVTLALGPTGSDRVNFKMDPVEPPGLPSGIAGGRVIDAGGVPLDDAYVILYPRNTLSPILNTTGEMATDVSGAFEFTGVVEGPYVLWGGKPGFGVRAQEIFVTADLTWDGEIVLDGSYSVDF